MALPLSFSLGGAFVVLQSFSSKHINVFSLSPRKLTRLLTFYVLFGILREKNCFLCRKIIESFVCLDNHHLENIKFSHFERNIWFFKCRRTINQCTNRFI